MVAHEKIHIQTLSRVNRYTHCAVNLRGTPCILLRMSSRHHTSYTSVVVIIVVCSSIVKDDENGKKNT